MSFIRFSYDSEGDILDIIFGVGTPDRRTSFELCDAIVLAVDTETDRPLGLTFISYSKLIGRKIVSLDLLAQMPKVEQDRLIEIVRSDALKPFLTIDRSKIYEAKIGNPKVNELIRVA